MKNQVVLVGLFLLFFSYTTFGQDLAYHQPVKQNARKTLDPPPPPESSLQSHIYNLYHQSQLYKQHLSYDVFEKAVVGFYNLKAEGLFTEKELLTIIDFTQPSSEERLYIIDLQNQKLLHRSLVAHGKNTGDIYATHFSNRVGSLQSSLGFYKASEAYIGKYGLSLKLDGLETRINDNARKRAVVMHPADYVNYQFIRDNQRLGRSFGCPAIPYEKHKQIIKTIQGNTCLFIYQNATSYLRNTEKLNFDKAEQAFLREQVLLHANQMASVL
ncbi:murein L,D-transpeptidase catalytic domain family protein [Rapidithrix thailandica]|uniref:Murein L,D-transpeptidase catalytic domain family protein n=1 Tax=Rapidithrix thailandica TaxID=413964 RepID=A0AAW9SB18_9BACT